MPRAATGKASNPSDLIVGLDPSSTRVGLVVLRGTEIERLEVLRNTRRVEPMVRILGLAERVRELLEGLPDAVVGVEISSGKVARRIKGRAVGSGLPVYGMAVGAVAIAAAWSPAPSWVLGVLENVWTCGKPKAGRLELLRLQFPAYREFAADGGDADGDAGDALGLAVKLRTWIDTAGLYRQYAPGSGPLPARTVLDLSELPIVVMKGGNDVP